MQLACWALVHLSSRPLHMLHWGLEERRLDDMPGRNGQQRPSDHSVDDPGQIHASMFPAKNGTRSLQSCTVLNVCMLEARNGQPAVPAWAAEPFSAVGAAAETGAEEASPLSRSWAAPGSWPLDSGAAGRFGADCSRSSVTCTKA